MLKSLELNGFKSFAKKTELSFGSSVSAVVGPNGSGKSNVVEAFRFVLGEQSIKSMRGKSGSDLIFKGSKTIAKLNRAKVAIVFDNKNKVFSLGDDSETSLSLDFDTIEISREVFSDGSNKYLINGSEVRLKDIHELLASVNIGSSGHHIISQGQADRLLSSTAKDRRGMIEDALGLKLYQIKMKDAEKKLEKTSLNIQEVESLRREIAPHMRYLKKQVEKIQQAQELRISLGSAYRQYLKAQDYILVSEQETMSRDQKLITENLGDIDTKLSLFGAGQQFEAPTPISGSIESNEQKLRDLSNTKDELSRAATRLEVMIEMSSPKKLEISSGQDLLSLNKNDFEVFVRDVLVFVDQSLKSEALDDVRSFVFRIRDSVEHLKQKIQYKKDATQSQVKDQETVIDKESLKQELSKIQTQMDDIVQSINQTNIEITALKNQLETSRNTFYESQRERFEIEKKRAVLVSQQETVHERIVRLRESRQRLEEEIREGVTLVGKDILNYNEHTLEGIPTRDSVEEIRRSIERTKIKLEEAGAGGGEDALKEFEEVFSRDEFLAKELVDLQTAMSSLSELIQGLKKTLDEEFKVGITKINKEFQEFFSLMFGGGTAELSVVAKQSRKKKDAEDDEETVEEESKEEGVEIDVSLPQKKVRELTMLSGGERSLTSIALLFAMSQVNPPPFLVLDETDAALDEANSRRYGDMIEKLSEYSQLIVVTHNRETMSRAKSIYGVTIGGDGASKLLSIKFDEAESYAK